MIVQKYYGGWHTTNIQQGGVKSHRGWSYLEKYLRDAGDLKEDEHVERFEFNADGFTFTIGKKEDWGK